MKYLRFLPLVLALYFLSLAFVSSFADPRELGARFLAQVVGVSAGVLPNPDNTIAGQLQQKEENLNERENELAAREAVLNSNGAGASVSFNYSLLGELMLLSLISANFYFDYRRAHVRA